MAVIDNATAAIFDKLDMIGSWIAVVCQTQMESPIDAPVRLILETHLLLSFRIKGPVYSKLNNLWTTMAPNKEDNVYIIFVSYHHLRCWLFSMANISESLPIQSSLQYGPSFGPIGVSNHLGFNSSLQPNNMLDIPLY